MSVGHMIKRLSGSRSHRESVTKLSSEGEVQVTTRMKDHKLRPLEVAQVVQVVLARGTSHWAVALVLLDMDSREQLATVSTMPPITEDKPIATTPFLLPQMQLVVPR
jgi:hypothetical protein